MRHQLLMQAWQTMLLLLLQWLHILQYWQVR